MSESIAGQVTINESEKQAGIVVRAVHEPTGSVFAKKTDTEGHFHFKRLKPGGPYVLSIDANGFEAIELTGVHLKTGESLTQDINLLKAQ